MLQIETTSVADQVEDILERRILEGVLRADDLLPSFASLAQELGCHHTTVGVAVARLEAKGLIRRERGIGFVVVDLLRSADLAVLISLIRIAKEPSRRLELLAQLLGFLKPMLCDIVERACDHATTEHLRWFDSTLDSMVSNTGRAEHRELVGRAEMDLLRVLSAASGNVVYTVIFNSLWSLFVPQSAFDDRDTLFEPKRYLELGREVGLRERGKAVEVVEAMVGELEERCITKLRELGWMEADGGRVFKPATDPVDPVSH